MTIKQWLVLIATGIMVMLVNIDMTVVNLALTRIAAFFKADLNQAQWVISSYLLATALSFVIFGRLADWWGRKKIFIMGVILFTVSSALTGMTHHLTILIISRFIQGLGFAATLGLSIVLTTQAFPANQKGFATSMVVTISGLSQAIGPTLGGIILQNLNWQWIFLINVPLGIISLIMTWLFVTNDKTADNKNFVFSFLNAGLFMVGLGIILISLNQIAIFNWKIILILLVLGTILLTAFIKDTIKNPGAIFDSALLKNSDYLHIVTLRFFFMMALSSMLFLTPLYLQNILNFSPIITGLILLTMTVFVPIASPISGKLIDKIGFCYPLIASFVLAAISTLLMLTLQATVSVVDIGLSFMLFGLAIGIHTVTSTHGALTQVPPEKSGAAIGLFFTAAISGSIVGVALSGTLLNIISNHSVYSIPSFMHAFHMVFGVISLLMLGSIYLSLKLLRSPSPLN